MVVDVEFALLLAVANLLAITVVAIYIKSRFKYRMSELDSSLRALLSNREEGLEAKLSARVEDVNSSLLGELGNLGLEVKGEFSEVNSVFERRLSDVEVAQKKSFGSLKLLLSERIDQVEKKSIEDDQVLLNGVRGELVGVENVFGRSFGELEQRLDKSISKIGRDLNFCLEGTDKRLAALEAELDNSASRTEKQLKEYHEEINDGFATTVANVEGRFVKEIDRVESNFTSNINYVRDRLGARVKQEVDVSSERIQTLANDVKGELTKFHDGLSAAIQTVKRDVELQLAVDRVADVEQLAICSGLLAARACAGRADEKFYLSSVMHGHASMIEVLLLDRAAGITPKLNNGCHILEIGTTREKQWAQMSTSRLALISRAFGYKMVSVDIDPENTKSGNEVKNNYGDVINAVTDSGEHFLQQWEGELPCYVYIDAYDFDHGSHSEQRQERYRILQGSSISDEACWKMHLDCAVEFVKKCPDGGVVVFDDVFYEDGEWLGKGKTAVPHMLNNGFEMVTRTSKTVVFRKK